MRTLCSTDAIFWELAPKQETLAGIPHSIFRDLINRVFEAEVTPKLQDHCCDATAPCVVVRRAMQTCVRLLSVCKTWKDFVSTMLKDSRHSKLLVPATNYQLPSSYGSSTKIARDYSLGGRYRAYLAIETEYEKSVLHAYDYGGPDGCHGKTKVIMKVSASSAQHDNERDAYTWLAESKFDALEVPHLHFEGRYVTSNYYCLVLDELGPDLERLRAKCRHKRFTPKMTLAVAIQTVLKHLHVRIYEKLHAHGWLHSNAKTGNFAIGPDVPGKANRIFLFDFEWSHRLEPTPSMAADCSGWNYRFKPVTWEMRLTPSRRDDLEGLGYVFAYLERGSHPWQHGSSLEMWRIKISTPAKKLFEGMDPVYVQYFNEVKALAWGEIPDYEGITRRFVEVWERRGYGGTPGEIDWWDEFSLRITDA